MQQFEITLKNEKRVSYDRLSWFIIIINAIVFLYLSISTTEKKIRFITICALGFMTLYFFLRRSFRNTDRPVGHHPFFFFLMMGWGLMEKYWIAAIAFAFDLLFTIAIRKLSVAVSKDGINYPSYPSKKITWSDLSNIILKDGLLTINYKNDRFIQQFIDETKTSINEQEFNDFCAQQLALAASHLPKSSTEQA